MENIIKLNNNYYIKQVNKNNEIPLESIDIESLTLTKILKKEKIILKIDFNKFTTKNYKKILKKLLFIKNIALILKKDFG